MINDDDDEIVLKPGNMTKVTLMAKVLYGIVMATVIKLEYSDDSLLAHQSTNWNNQKRPCLGPLH